MDDKALSTVLVTESAALAADMLVAGVAAERKTSASDLVTAADRAAEGHIRDVLARERPGDGLLGEEGNASGGVTGRRWVADPIDGTFNYVSGLPAWCSAVALEVDGRLTTAAVRRPVQLRWPAGAVPAPADAAAALDAARPPSCSCRRPAGARQLGEHVGRAVQRHPPAPGPA